MRFRRRAARENPIVTIYYASDVHGSERCWRKFLGAPKFYGAEHAIMGGDLTGKALVPIARRPDGAFEATFLGQRHSAADEAELEELLEAVRFNGMYPWVATAAEIDEARVDADTRSRLLDEVMLGEIRRWVVLADERSAAGTATYYVMAGNDDPLEVDDVLRSAAAMVFCDERIVRVGPFEMVSCSYANPTPWDSPRELDESGLHRRVEAQVAQLEDPSRAIFNLHVPPFDTGLDTARKLNADLTPVYEAGAPLEVPVGSTAVRQLIEDYQPLVALHGHIHESRGESRIGRTRVINPGSEYNTGRIHGTLVRLAPDHVLSSQFVVG